MGKLARVPGHLSNIHTGCASSSELHHYAPHNSHHPAPPDIHPVKAVIHRNIYPKGRLKPYQATGQWIRKATVEPGEREKKHRALRALHALHARDDAAWGGHYHDADEIHTKSV